MQGAKLLDGSFHTDSVSHAGGRVLPRHGSAKMAAAAVGAALTEESVRQAVEAAAAARALSSRFLVLAEELADGVNLICGFLVCVRAGGFMVVFPPDEVINQCLDNLSLEHGYPTPLLHAGQVAVETTRGRRVGEAVVQLADLSWDYVQHSVSLGRITAAQRTKILSFSLKPQR